MNGAMDNESERREMDAALIRAASDLDVEEVERLIAAGADVRASDERGRTALHAVAAAAGDDESDNANRPDLRIIALLLSVGADVDAMDNDERTPVFEAVRGDGPNMAAIRALHAAGGDIDAADADGITPLMTVFEGFFDPEPVALLLELGADPIREDLDGRSAWDRANAEELDDDADEVRRLMRVAIAARGLDVPMPRGRAAPLEGPSLLDEIRSDLADGPKTMNAEEWIFTIWSAALQLVGAWLLWRWGMELPALIWVVMTPVNVVLMVESKRIMREQFFAPTFWKRVLWFASLPASFAVLLILHWYKLHVVVWILLAIYLALVVVTLWLMAIARRAAEADKQMSSG